jgi:uncharacterized protein YjbI with pentapeptide repeats
MKTKNLTPFPFATRVTSRRPPRPEMTLILRACYVLAPGKPLALPEGPSLVAQGPIQADTYRDEDEDRAGECLYPGDFADWKPRAEVMLRGTCHTPFGKPLTECPVRFEVGRWSKLLRVVGRRVWSDDLAGARMSEPSPFTRMPVDYAHAFGGPGYAANPAGMGFAGRELPNVEHAGAAIRARRDDPGPAGLGPLNPAWAQRAGKVGKAYGPRWQKERSPWYAEDFDWTYFNAAPGDQQLEGFLRGDERLVFQNLHPTEQVFETTLPGLRTRAFVNDTKRRFREVPMSLDTLFVDLDQGRLYLTWRGLDAIETDDKKDVQTVLVASEDLAAAPLPAAHYRARLEAFEADPLGIKEHLPPEMAAMVEEARERQKALAEGRSVRRPGGPPPDPTTALLQKQFDASPVPLPGGGEIEKKVAEAVARVPPQVGLAQAANDAAARFALPPRPPAIPLRPGPVPAWAAKGASQALAQVAHAKELAAAGQLSKEEAAEIAEIDAQLRQSPSLSAILSPPAYTEPGPGKDLGGQDYEDRDLRGVDLRGCILRDTNLAGANLAGASFAGGNLEGAVLSGANLEGADFTGADMTLANLTGVRARGAVFREAILNRAFLHQADLSEAVFGGARGELVFLPEANLERADCRGLSLFRSFAKGAFLAGADFSEASLVRCLFLEVDAKGVNLSRALVTRTSFARADLTRANLTAARGERSAWLGARLHDADFTRAILPRSHFMEASAIRASFRRSILKESRCYRASFEHADFTESQLMGVDFTKCMLTDARFTGACLYDAKFRQAAGERCDFTGANLKRALLERA